MKAIEKALVYTLVKHNYDGEMRPSTGICTSTNYGLILSRFMGECKNWYDQYQDNDAIEWDKFIYEDEKENMPFFFCDEFIEKELGWFEIVKSDLIV